MKKNKKLSFKTLDSTARIYEVHTISFQTFFVWAILLTVHTRNSSPLHSNLLRLQCTCFTVPTTSRRPHQSPLVWACQWPSSLSLSSPQLSHNDKEQVLDYREAEELSWYPSWSNSLWQGWSCSLVDCPGPRQFQMSIRKSLETYRIHLVKREFGI